MERCFIRLIACVCVCLCIHVGIALHDKRSPRIGKGRENRKQESIQKKGGV